MSAILMPGITVAQGCVVAAGAVVVKDTDPNCLYAGIPAKKIKDLPISDMQSQTSILKVNEI